MRLFSIALFLVLISFLGELSFAQERDPQFTYQDLQTLIKSKGITQIDDLVEQLPFKLTYNPLLVYETRALRGGRVSFKTPRVILFNNDASLVLAMTRNPGKEEISLGEDDLEVLFFDHKKAKYNIEKVIFNGKDVPYIKNEKKLVHRNPSQCLVCHGKNPRPLFADYNGWPGFYGSFGQNGYAVKGSTEYKELKDFLHSYKGLKRYEHLTIKKRENNLGIYLPSTGFGGIYNREEFSQNLVFGAFTEYLMEKKVSQHVRKHTNFKTFKPVLQYLAAGCEDSRVRVKKVYQAWVGNDEQREKVTQRVLKSIESQIYKDFKSRERQLLRNNYIELSVDERGLMNIPYEQIYIGSPPWAKIDKDFFQKQLVLMEAFFQYFDLKNEDISTVHGEPTSGIFHIRKLSLYKDEPYFELLKDGFDSFEPNLMSRNCSDELIAEMEVAVKSFPLPYEENKAPVLY